MTVRFDIPDGVRFTCSQCGDCCRDLSVLLAPGERERLSALDWAGRADDLVGTAASVRVNEGDQRGRHRLARRADGACVFLGERQQCRIHEHFSEAAKPHLCRIYPFGFRNLGDRVAVDVAFSCRAVSEGAGAPIAERVGEWTDLLAASPLPAPPRARLQDRRPIGPDALREIERLVIGLLGDTSRTLRERVRAVLLFMRLATTGDPGTPAAQVMREAMARSLAERLPDESDPGIMDDTQRAVFRQWLFLALNAPGAGFTDLPARERDREVQRRRRAAIAFRDGVGQPWIGSAPIAATFEDVSRVDPGVLRAGPEWIATFLAAKIVGQRFLAAGPGDIPLVDGMRLLMLCHPMIAWTALALAAGRSAPTAGERDVRAAIRLVDRTLGQISTSLLPKKQQSAFDWVFHETEIVTAATAEILGAAGAGSDLKGPRGAPLTGS